MMKANALIVEQWRRQARLIVTDPSVRLTLRRLAWAFLRQWGARS